MDNQHPVSKPTSQNGDPTTEIAAGALLSHDLRSAVSDIIGGLHLLDLTGISSENQAQIGRISASAGLLFRLLEKSLGGEAPPNDLAVGNRAIPTKLTELLNDLERRWKARASAKGIILAFEQDFDPSQLLQCDHLALERLLSNVLDNAVKYTDSGQIRLKTEVRGSDQLRFSVQDNGPGFSTEALEKLFSFGGRPGQSNKPGSGLGLHIAQKMVQRLSGEIDVSNTAGGALVQVRIPLLEEVDPPVEMGSRWTGAQPVQHLAGLRVLLAEDNKTNQIVAGQMLRALGAEVSVAADGVEAWEMLEMQEMDLAILDIEMPRKSGLELIREIRARNDAKSKMPLIALTAYVMREHRERIMANGADGIIAKPLMNIGDFGDSIQQLMGVPVAIRNRETRQSGAVDGPVDMYVYNSLCKTIGEAAFSELLVKLLDDLSTVQNRLRDAFANGDASQARGASHVLISLAGAVGATRLQEVAQSLNSAAHNPGNQEISEFENRSLELLDELTDFLETARGVSYEG